MVEPPPSKGKGVEGPAQHRRSGERSTFNEALGSYVTDGPQGSQHVTSRATEEPSVNTKAPAADLLVVDHPAKYALVEKLAKSWNLAPSDSAEPSAIDEEQVVIAEVG